jgi:hypothetical protein
MTDPFARIASIIQDATLAPDFWPPVLASLSEALGAVGAAYVSVCVARLAVVHQSGTLQPAP